MSKKIFIGITATTLLILVGLGLYRQFSNASVVYVDIGKLVANYQLKKDLEGNATSNLMMIKNALDSMKLATLRNADHSALDTNIKRLEYEFTRYYSQSNEEITQKVWERLNPAIQKFGEEKGYEIIIGANGAGTVLYGIKKLDITDKVLTYINEGYEKGI
jgi:Skp family chaperone for outer membrane proteins